jgi:hypothetical protein
MFGIKYLVVWLLANYSYDNVVKTYNAYNNENTFGEMSKFIKDQQYREDQLREECNLQYYKIKRKPTIFNELTTYVKETYQDTSISKHIIFKNLISTLNFNIPYIYIMESKLNAGTLEEFYNKSYDKNNLNKVIHFNQLDYTIVHSGVKVYTNIYRSYSNQQHLPDPRNPKWTITLGNNTLTITDIK